MFRLRFKSLLSSHYTDYLRRAVSFFFGVMLILSAAGKITHLGAFIEQLGSYQIIPPFIVINNFPIHLVRIAAFLVVIVEMSLGFAILFFPACSPRGEAEGRYTLRAISALMFVFAAAMSFALFENRNIDCGCFLPFWGESKVSWVLVIRNVLFAALALVASMPPEPGAPFLRHAMRTMKRQFFSILGTAIFLMVCVGAARTVVRTAGLEQELRLCQQEHPGLVAGTILPPVITLDTFGGETRRVDFSSKQHTFLLFFSAACPHCKHIAPWWQKLYEKHSATHQFFGIANGTKEEVDRFAKETGARFPMYLLGGGLTIKDFRVFRFPRTILVDAKGNVKAFLKGNISDAEKGEFERTYLKEQESVK